MRFSPPGPTSRTSMSSGLLWLTPLSVRLTSVIVPVRPLTNTLEGYGVAGWFACAALLIVIVPGLQNWLPVTVVWLFTTCVSDPLLVANVAVPLYVATTWCEPSVRLLVLNDACPLAFTATFDATVAPSTVNVTVPVGTGTAPLVTVAVKVTESPVNDGLSSDVTMVVVGCAAALVVMSRHHEAMLPAPPPSESSTTYRFHVPFGFRPLNAASVVLADGAGAGAGKASSAVASKSVGLKVPELHAVESGSPVAAASSSVRSTLLAAFRPPVSDTARRLVPPGASSTMSRSSVLGSVTSLNVRFTSEIVPTCPETTSVEGYGVAEFGGWATTRSFIVMPLAVQTGAAEAIPDRATSATGSIAATTSIEVSAPSAPRLGRARRRVPESSRIDRCMVPPLPVGRVVLHRFFQRRRATSPHADAAS